MSYSPFIPAIEPLGLAEIVDGYEDAIWAIQSGPTVHLRWAQYKRSRVTTYLQTAVFDLCEAEYRAHD